MQRARCSRVLKDARDLVDADREALPVEDRVARRADGKVGAAKAGEAGDVDAAGRPGRIGLRLLRRDTEASRDRSRDERFTQRRRAGFSTHLYPPMTARVILCPARSSIEFFAECWRGEL